MNLKDQVLTPGNEKSILDVENKMLLDPSPNGESHASEIQENLENKLKKVK